ncbi:uncharacterized protein LOC144284463 isoform X1 [Canis aureus]
MELEGIMLSEALTAQILQERSQRPEVACSVPEPCKARSGVQPLSTLSEVDARRSQVAQDHTAQPHWPRAGDLRVPTGGSGGSSDEQMAFGRFASRTHSKGSGRYLSTPGIKEPGLGGVAKSVCLQGTAEEQSI